jgi:predicted Mrr-cat superfamily restriction endonuclease
VDLWDFLFKLKNMKILRTDSGGENFTNERLQMIRKMLGYFEIKNIYLLHDHKGILTVTWEEEPTQNEKLKVEQAWQFFNEFNIEHRIIIFKQL